VLILPAYRRRRAELHAGSSFQAHKTPS
jgi:hypothetical protein